MTTDEFEDDDIESWKFMPVGDKVRTRVYPTPPLRYWSYITVLTCSSTLVYTLHR